MSQEKLFAFTEWTHKPECNYVFEHGKWRMWDDDSYISTEKLFEIFEEQDRDAVIYENVVSQKYLS